MPVGFLAIIDDVLLFSYDHSAEQKGYALDMLRFIGDTISKGMDGDIVGLITGVQRSICRWISDADCVLSEDEHLGVVSSVQLISDLRSHLSLGHIYLFCHSRKVGGR